MIINSDLSDAGEAGDVATGGRGSSGGESSTVATVLSEDDVRAGRLALGVVPVTKQVDTLAAEIPAQSNYLYLTYHGDRSDRVTPAAACAPIDCEHLNAAVTGPTASDSDTDSGTGLGTHGDGTGGVLVLGCGAYRIGSSCEFDWCAVSCARALRAAGVPAVVINYNPETVSTDYDESDRLYFEELSLERVLDVAAAEAARGVVVSVGGQIPNNLAGPLAARGVTLLGTPADSIDAAENRARFSTLLDGLGVEQPAWRQLTSLQDTLAFAKSVGFPVLVRPSYVLSGAAMNVARSESDLVRYLEQAAGLSAVALPVVVSKFIANAKEIEYDGVAAAGRILNFAISEHIENAGVHSGDATLVLPAQKLYVETLKRVRRIAARIARRLNVTGPFNIQFMAKDNDVLVIECNLRASRSFPFVSKTFNVDLIALATRAMLGLPVKPAEIRLLDAEHVCVKAPVFSFARLAGADPVLRVEMSSTGEVAAFGADVTEAYLTALLATNFRLPPRGSALVLSAGPLESKLDFLPAARALQRLGYKLLGTRRTAEFFSQHGVAVARVAKPSEDEAGAGDAAQQLENSAGDTAAVAGGSGRVPSVIEAIRSGAVGLVVNVPSSDEAVEVTDGYRIRRAAVDFGVPLVTNVKTALLLVDAIERTAAVADRAAAAAAAAAGGGAGAVRAAVGGSPMSSPYRGHALPAGGGGTHITHTTAGSRRTAPGVVLGADGDPLPKVRSWAEVMLASGMLDINTS